MDNNPHYAPCNLMDMLVRVFRVRNDRQLAERLGVEPSQICKIRKRRAPVSSAFLINIHEETGFSLAVLRGLMGDFRDNTGPKAVHPAVPPSERLDELQRLQDVYRPDIMQARGGRTALATHAHVTS
jgi:transcriptional regulator with XRE-family HTH domain